MASLAPTGSKGCHQARGKSEARRAPSSFQRRRRRARALAPRACGEGFRQPKVFHVPDDEGCVPGCTESPTGFNCNPRCAIRGSAGDAGLWVGGKTPSEATMIQRIIEWSLKTASSSAVAPLMLIALGVRACWQDAGGCHSRPHGESGARLCRLDGPQSAGGGGSGDVPSFDRPARSRGREGRARDLDVRLLAHHDHLRGQRSTLISRGRVLERLNYLQSLDARRCEAATRPGRLGLAGCIILSRTLIPPAPGGGYDLGKLRSFADWHALSTRQRARRGGSPASIGGFREAISD